MAECFESQVVEFRLTRWTLKGYCSFTGDHSGCFEQVGLELEQDCMLGDHRIVHSFLSARLWCGSTLSAGDGKKWKPAKDSESARVNLNVCCAVRSHSVVSDCV